MSTWISVFSVVGMLVNFNALHITDFLPFVHLHTQLSGQLAVQSSLVTCDVRNKISTAKEKRENLLLVLPPTHTHTHIQPTNQPTNMQRIYEQLQNEHANVFTVRTENASSVRRRWFACLFSDYHQQQQRLNVNNHHSPPFTSWMSLKHYEWAAEEFRRTSISYHDAHRHSFTRNMKANHTIFCNIIHEHVRNLLVHFRIPSHWPTTRYTIK